MKSEKRRKLRRMDTKEKANELALTCAYATEGLKISFREFAGNTFKSEMERRAEIIKSTLGLEQLLEDYAKAHLHS